MRHAVDRSLIPGISRDDKVYVTGIDVSPTDENILVVGYSVGIVLLWDLSEYVTIKVFPLPTNGPSLTALTFDPTGKVEWALP